jgi:hypothetical protein
LSGEGAGQGAGADPGRPSKIYAHLPYVIELEDEVVRTRDNALMLSLEITGIDGVTSGTSAISVLRAGFAHLLDTLDERFTFYLHRMMRPTEPGLAPIHGSSFAADIDHAWRRELARRSLQEIRADPHRGAPPGRTACRAALRQSRRERSGVKTPPGGWRSCAKSSRSSRPASASRRGG